MLDTKYILSVLAGSLLLLVGCDDELATFWWTPS